MHLVPRGFRFAGVHAGIKRNPAKEDIALIVADEPAVAAGVYTQNLVFAAPVALDRERTPSDKIRCVVVNSGNANACTGERGLQDAHKMARLATSACGASAEQALVMSTGIIGEFLPMEKIASGIAAASQQLGNNEEAFLAAARGILTTDKGVKAVSRSFNFGGQEVRFAGMAKGAGMIGPRMATLLGVLLTDAKLTVADAQASLADAIANSFNCISVEGHMSTNDTVLLLASGAATKEPLQGADLAAFQTALKETAIELAKMIPDDGEGATHLMVIDVLGAKTRDGAHQIAKTIADSALVKTAIHGGDPNWGRIVSAAGYAGVPFNPAGVNLRVNDFPLYEKGAPVKFDAVTVSESMQSNRETHIELTISEGDAQVRFWSSDLTIEYVKFNADYHT
ncbi:MAG TPA: bifunctional glutamate N-acetyltransferase/amino-acid acetyltransferase ArgJ [Pirellulaceae bacterium]|nr:bifunctional glutamate N-acetyltransferase/amino-acid acetyltransferase ArgJ [Pirellulaceae bacterium]